MASNLPRATIADILTINRVVQFLRDTSDRTLKIWPIPVKVLHLFSFSDAGGVLSRHSGEWFEGKTEEPTQGAWLIFAGRCRGKNAVSQMSPLMWRSGKLKRKVPSTLAGETLALGEAVAAVEWLQIFLADVIWGSASRQEWTDSLSEHSIGVSAESKLSQGHDHSHSQSHIIDAKAVFDALQKEAAGSKQDRRAAIDLAIIQESINKAGAQMKWIPHNKMLADPLTKVDPQKGSAALEHVLDSGLFRFVDPIEELAWRAQDVRHKNRSRSFSQRRAQEESGINFLAALCFKGFPNGRSEDAKESEEAESWGYCREYALSSSDLDILLSVAGSG